MNEKNQSSPYGVTTEDRQRLEYAAVPLDPYRATYPGKLERYDTESFTHIVRKLGAVADRAIEMGWYTGENNEADDRRQAFIADSLFDAHNMRLINNTSYYFNGEDADGNRSVPYDGDDERVKRALAGTSHPSELFDVLSDYPEITSVELAKLSHPFDPLATSAMDQHIQQVIDAASMREPIVAPKARKMHEHELESEELPAKYTINGAPHEILPSYKMKRRVVSDDFTAAIVVRKLPIAERDTPNGTVQIVRRSSFAVRGDEMARELDPLLDRKIKNNDRFGELCEKVEAYLPHLELAPELCWLQPTATSYYAKYL